MRLADIWEKDLDCYSKQSAVTIVETCNGCDHVVRGSGGNKLSCGNPRIMSKRPYSNGTAGELTRSVVANMMPTWCPLYES
jgi:hypothetical protein